MKEVSMSMKNNQQRERRLANIKNVNEGNQGMSVFENAEFGKIRTITKDNEAWFVGKDICEFFGDSNHKRSLGRLDDDEKILSDVNDNLGRTQKAIFVNESGLYNLLFQFSPEKSTKDGGTHKTSHIEDRILKIKRFKKWVTSEVLPTIRKTGGYVAENRAIDFVNNWLPTLDDVSKNAIASVLEENRKLVIQNSKQKEEIVKQKNTIHELTSVVDSVVLRKTFTDYVNMVVKHTGIDYSMAYNKIYELVGRMLKKDLKLSYEKYKVSERELVDSNKLKNRENNLKGIDRFVPFTYKASNCNISMVEYIVDVLEKPQVLIEAIASVCEVGVSEVLDTYQMFRDDKITDLER